LRIKIDFISQSKYGIRLPLHYNYLLQGFIYKNLSRHLARFIHNQGYQYEKRRFRFFTFSRLLGKFRIDRDWIIYPKICTLWIASPIIKILESFAGSLAREGCIQLGDNLCEVTSIEVPFTKKYEKEIEIRTLSPITVYSTLLTPDRKKKTYYYSPFEPEFSKLILQNLIKKYLALHPDKKDNLQVFSITPRWVSKKNEHIIYYKKTIIKAWSGIYRIKGSQGLLELAFDSGLGSKNSQGFGMIEEYKN